MGTRETLFLAMSAFLVSATTGTTDTAFDADSWDMAVTISNEIHFFKNDIEVRYVTAANISELYALAYDSANRTLYVNGENQTNSHYSNVYYSDLAEEDLNLQPTLDVPDTLRIYKIPTMVVDPMDKILFFIHPYMECCVMRMEFASYGIGTQSHVFQGVISHTAANGIALDICHRFIYWGERDHFNEVNNIKRSNLDGSDAKVIVSDGLDHVLDLAVDSKGGKLYFATVNLMDFPRHTIEESNLDGTDRRVLVNDTNQLPLQLAVDETAVYWIDSRYSNSIWKVYKNGTEKVEIKSFKNTYSSGISLNSILTRYNVGDIDCKAVLDGEQIATPEPMLAQHHSP